MRARTDFVRQMKMICGRRPNVSSPFCIASSSVSPGNLARGGR